MTTPVKPLLTISRRAKVDDATLDMIRKAGYCVVVVRDHADVQVRDPLAQITGDIAANEVLDAAIATISEAKSFDNVKDLFAKKLSKLVLDRLGLARAEKAHP